MINIILLVLLVTDLFYNYKKIKIDKRKCKAYEDLTIETKKAREDKKID